MVARVALLTVFVLALAGPARAEEDLWGSSPKKSTKAATSSKKPEGGKYGLGIAIGAPTGLTGKMRLNPANAVDAAFAWNDGSFYLHGDYLFAGKKKLVDGRSADVGWFIGLGGRAIMVQDAQGGTTFVSMAAKKNGNGNGNGNTGTAATSTSSNLGLGARIPAGLSLKFDAARPLELYGEIALDVGVLNGDGTAILGAVGGRWFF